MPFEKGKSGNPYGRRKGAVSQKLALKNLLEEVFTENRPKAKKMLVAMLNDKVQFRKLCELKSEFEIKEMITKIEGELSGDFKLTIEIANENQATPEAGNRISQYIEV